MTASVIASNPEAFRVQFQVGDTTLAKTLPYDSKRFRILPIHQVNDVLKAEIAELNSKKEAAINEEEFLRAHEYRQKIHELQAKLTELQELPAARRALGAAETKLAELKALKAQKLLEEDFAVLIRVKDEIQEQEAEVQKLQQKVKSLTVKGSGFADIADSGHQAPASTHQPPATSQ